MIQVVSIENSRKITLLEAQYDDYVRTHEVTMRKTEPAAILETCRKSTISFNFDFDNESDDIMSSVLAVMDKLKNVRLSEGIGFTYLTKYFESEVLNQKF